MSEDITFVVHSEWLDSIKNLPVEQQDKIISEIVRYGTDLEPLHEDDAVVQAFVNIVKGRIDFSKNKYNQKVEMSKNAGRKKVVDEVEILRLAREGKSSSTIAQLLGCSKSTIDHSEAWKKRKENSDENSDEETIDYSQGFTF